MMTDNDRKLINAAWHADTDEAREELRFLKRRAYHREEARCGNL